MERQAGTGHAADVDRERSRVFLEKADVALPDATLAGLRATTDSALGIDAGFLRAAMNAFAIPPAARISRSGTQGTFHRLYDVLEPGREARLLRVAAMEGDAWRDLMALECSVMSALRTQGFPVPGCEYRGVLHEGIVRGVHLVELAPGVGLSTLDDDEGRMTTALAWVAAFLARLHRIRGTGFGPVSLVPLGDVPAAVAFKGLHASWDDFVFLRLDEHVNHCAAHGAITSREASDIAAHFAAHRPGLRSQPAALLHGDPGSHNFLVDEAGIRGVIDWEDALLGDPLFDLASLCTFHPERRHAPIWSAYGARLAPGSEEWTRFWLYFLRIALAKTVHRSRFAYADRPDRPPASQRIQLALAKLGAGK